MSFQTLYVTKGCKIVVEKGQLVLDSGPQVRLPLEDIGTLVLESQRVTITTACLSRLAEAGCAVILCGANHKPIALQLPYLPHSRQALVNREQLQWDEPFKKRCHQEIIRHKILNQALCMELLGGEDPQSLMVLSSQVRLGDKTHMEALGASHYFQWLLKGHSRRDEGYVYNAYLDYGYAILRAKIAQALTASGFIPSIGLFHRSELNNFNLADDIIEPFRPFVDYYVHDRIQEPGELKTPTKALILGLLEAEVKREGQPCLSVSGHIQRSVHSLREASQDRDCKRLSFPSLGVLQERGYE